MHCVPEDAKRKRGRCFRGRRCSLPDTIVGRNEFYSLIAMCDLDGMIMRGCHLVCNETVDTEKFLAAFERKMVRHFSVLLRLF